VRGDAYYNIHTDDEYNANDEHLELFKWNCVPQLGEVWVRVIRASAGSNAQTDTDVGVNTQQKVENTSSTRSTDTNYICDGDGGEDDAMLTFIPEAPIVTTPLTIPTTKISLGVTSSTTKHTSDTVFFTLLRQCTTMNELCTKVSWY